MDKGFFAAEGIALDLVFIPANAAVIQQLAAGSLNLGIGNGLVDPIRAVSQGAPLAIIRIEGQAPPYALLAKPEIKSFAALKGKTISVGGAKDITRTYLERMLVPNQVAPGSYDMIFAGATSARFAALQSGAADAALLTAPFNFRADDLGFTNLGLTVDYAADLPFAGTTVNTVWAGANVDRVRRFLAAYEKCVLWFDADANRGEAIRILADATHQDLGDIGKSYDFFRKIAFFEPTGKISRVKLGNVVKALQDMGDLDPGFAVDRLVMPGVGEFAD